MKRECTSLFIDMTYQIVVSCTNIKCYLVEICNNIKREMLHAKTENIKSMSHAPNNALLQHKFISSLVKRVNFICHRIVDDALTKQDVTDGVVFFKDPLSLKRCKRENRHQIVYSRLQINRADKTLSNVCGDLKKKKKLFQNVAKHERIIQTFITYRYL